MRFPVLVSLIFLLSSFAQAVSGGNQSTFSALDSISAAPSTSTDRSGAADIPKITGVFGSPITFGTHDEFAKYGFAWGPADGQFGAIPGDKKDYTF
jgi:hypothetical protein